MPELPEVETVRRGLDPLIRGARIVDAWGHPSPKFVTAPAAIDRTVTHVGRRGKYLLIGLDDGRRLIVHLGMTGQLRVDPSDQPLDPHDRAWWRLADGRRIIYRDVRRFGRIAVLGDDVSELPTLAALGLEPDDPAFTPERLWRNINSSRARIKTQLLSQRPVAGIGNIYADEALWRARIHPAARRVSRVAAERLHIAIVEVLQAAIDNGGTTLRDYRTVDGGVGTNQAELLCYGRSGSPCDRCATLLRRSVWDGRSTTWCPTCQRR